MFDPLLHQSPDNLIEAGLLQLPSFGFGVARAIE